MFSILGISALSGTIGMVVSIIKAVGGAVEIAKAVKAAVPVEHHMTTMVAPVGTPVQLGSQTVVPKQAAPVPQQVQTTVAPPPKPAA